MRSLLSFLLLLGLTRSALIADDWPHWRGATRDGQSAESSRFEEGGWPPGEAVWQADVGLGSGSMVIAGDRLYVLGHSSGKETVSCLDVATGEAIWKRSTAAPPYGRHAIGDRSFYQGPSSTPEIDPQTGYVYTMGIDGDLRCWNARDDGAPVWGINLYDAYRIPQRPQVTKRPRSHRDYGYPTSPLAFAGGLLVEAGDPKRGNLLCFDKASGKLRWGSDNKDAAGHTGGPVPMSVGGIPCVAVLTATQLVVTRVDGRNAGQTVATYPWATDFINNIPCPVVDGDGVIITSKYNRSATEKIQISLRGGARRVWRSGRCSGVCTPIVHEGFIYFANEGFHCIRASDGRDVWEGGRYAAPGSLILTADERLIAWANDGDLTLVETADRSPKAYRELASQQRVLRDMAWPHVVLAGGRLFCKDRGGRIRCLALDKSLRLPVAREAEEPVRILTGFDLTEWPPAGGRELLSWKQGGGKRGIRGELTKGRGRFALTTQAGAAFVADGAMRPNGGAFQLAGDVVGLRDKLAASGEMTIELLIRSDELEQTGPTRILSFSESAYSRNFTIAQERDTLLLRLRTPRTGENGMKPQTELGRIRSGEPVHVMVSYRDGELACWLNGREACRSAAVRGGFENWTTQSLVVGNEADGGRAWNGTIYGFAISDKATGAAAAAKRYRAIAK